MLLTAIKTSDKSWEFAGFDSVPIICLQDLDIIFQPHASHQSGGLFALGFSNLPPHVVSLCGIPVFQWTKHTPSPLLSSITVDHIVIHTTQNLPSFKASFDKFGIPLRLERSDIYPGITQLFYRAGTIIEVASMTPSENDKAEHSFLWGLTLVSADLDALKLRLGDSASQPKQAIQRGRRIMTIRPRIETRTNMAFMTPHVKLNKL